MTTALTIALELIRKSGVREWQEPDTRLSIALAALEIAAILDGEPIMALPDVFRLQTGTTKTFKSSGGDAAITLASLANAAARQSAKLDLGASRARRYSVKANFELAATPTAGNTIDIYWAPSSSATAGTDNGGNVSGTDAAYTGYSSNLTDSLKQLVFVGSFICTAQATATVQKGFVGILHATQRYGSLVVVNNSGAALHSSDSNMEVVLTPQEDTVEDS